MMQSALYVLWFLPFFFPLTPTQRVNGTIHTSSGLIQGRKAASANVTEFLGIPYARPPIGDLRFAAPQTFTSNTTLPALNFSADCPQQGLTVPPLKYNDQTPQFKPIIEAFAGGRGNIQSEDCLTLNIWTKDPQSYRKRAVLIWLHGGRFTLGDSNTPFYTGQYLAAAEDIVVVTVNYRLNIFGFSGAPGQPANVGLLDQRKAIEWVRDNIAAFGGDPSRISLMGQSAGGAVADFYAYAYKDDPIVAGLISHSGTAFSFEANTPDFSRQSFTTAAKALNCSVSSEYGATQQQNDENMVACMRKMDVKRLLSAIPQVKPLPSLALAQPVFHPTVDNITVFDLATYRSLAATRAFARIPYLAGNTDHESGFYRISAATQNKTLTPEQWTQYESQGFTCAARDAVAARTNAGVPSWRYRYFAEWKNLELYPGSGAYHGSDLHMIFGASRDVTGIEQSSEEKAMVRKMQGFWGAFVRDPQRGLKGLGWPETSGRNGSKETLAGLGWRNEVGMRPLDPEQWDCECPADGGVKDAQGAF